jgi:hypothetical protein
MAIFLSNALALAITLQTSAAVPQDSTSPAERLRHQVTQDSTDGGAWLALGRVLVDLAHSYHEHDDATADTAWVRAVLDSADRALANATRWLTGTRAGDSAAVLRVSARAERSLLAWEVMGETGVTAAWRAADEARLPPLLEELGENLLRGCPRGGVLLTAGEMDGDAVGYMRFVRGLRSDVAVIPLRAWRNDGVLRRRMASELKLQRLVDRRPVCASMAFERPPDVRSPVRWHTRVLLWVSGPRATQDRVAPRDYVFAAMRLASDEHDTWFEPVLTVYRRAARQSPALCEAMRVYGLTARVGCK